MEIETGVEKELSTCGISFESEDGQCFTCGDVENFFIQETQPAQTKDYFWASLVNNLNKNSGLTIEGLEEGKEYVVAMQYQEGLKRSACYSVTPSKSISLTEANGESEAVEGDPRCFIATAAYGDPLAQELNVLRWFRDHVLMKTDVGKFLVETYYQMSPPVAEYISNSSVLKASVKISLWPLVSFIKVLKWISSWNYGWLWAAIIFMISLYFKTLRKSISY